MPPPKIFLYHPPFERMPHLPGWFADVETLMRDEAYFDSCEVERIPLNDQLGFDLSNETRRIMENPMPAIFVGKVQKQLFSFLIARTQRKAMLYTLISPTDSADVLSAVEEACKEFDGGEPKIFKRELVAYLVVAKLDRGKFWAGTAKNKEFLWADDIPNGGFPREVTKGEVKDAVDILHRCGVLEKKAGKPKYGLGEKGLVQQILDSKSFASVDDRITNWLQRKPARVSAKLLERNYQ